MAKNIEEHMPRSGCEAVSDLRKLSSDPPHASR